MSKSKNIKKKAINMYFNHKYRNGEKALLSKELICERLQISIYELDRIIGNHYAELDKVNVFRLMWTQSHPNSYTQTVKFSFIDSIMKQECVKLQKSQLKENICFDGGVSNAS